MRTASTEDHVFSRKTFRTTSRENALVVPCCQTCNGHKAVLEHYAGAVLLFASNHPDAAINLESVGARRLAKNRKLSRHIAETMRRAWQFDPRTGLFSQEMAFDVDASKISDLVSMMAKGLLWLFGNAALTNEHDTKCVWLYKNGGEEKFRLCLSRTAVMCASPWKAVSANVKD